MTESTGIATTVREVALAPGGEVSINLTSSDVRVTAVDGDTVTVRTRGGEDIEDEILVEDEPGRVFIRDAERGYRIGPVRFGSGGSVPLDIDVPRTARLTCKTLSGDVEAHGAVADDDRPPATSALGAVDAGRPDVARDRLRLEPDRARGLQEDVAAHRRDDVLEGRAEIGVEPDVAAGAGGLERLDPRGAEPQVAGHGARPDADRSSRFDGRVAGHRVQDQ